MFRSLVERSASRRVSLRPRAILHFQDALPHFVFGNSARLVLIESASDEDGVEHEARHEGACKELE